jgi:vacuolar-type H+-ATPase subunit C/Vma6
MKTTLNPADWTFTSGATAVAETRLLTDDEFLDLLRQPSLAALVQRIKQVETYVSLPQPEKPERTTRLVEREFLNAVLRHVRTSPDPVICELMLVKYFFAQLRTTLRDELSGAKSDDGRKAVFRAEEFYELAGPPRKGRPTFDEAAAELRARALKAAEPLRALDLMVDRAELVYFHDLACAVGSEFITHWAVRYTQLAGAMTIVRAKLAGARTEMLEECLLGAPLDDAMHAELVHEDRDRLDNVLTAHFHPIHDQIDDVTRGTIGKIARLVDDVLTDMMTGARRIAFGPERLMGYLWGLSIENLNLRLICETFVVEGDRDETRSKLRKSYT